MTTEEIKEGKKRCFLEAIGVILDHMFDAGYSKGKDEQITLDGKWIREHVGADVAVEFLKATEEYSNEGI